MYSWTLFMSQYIKDILCQEFSLGWQIRAIQVAQLCHRCGIVLPSLGHSRALGMAKEVVRMKKMADSLFFPVKSEYQNEFHP